MHLLPDHVNVTMPATLRLIALSYILFYLPYLLFHAGPIITSSDAKHDVLVLILKLDSLLLTFSVRISQW